MSDQHHLFPLFLKLSGRAVLVVGAGPVAEGKLKTLLEAGAAIHVVAPETTQAIDRMGVRISRREFQPADLEGAWFVVAAATPAANRRVAEEAERRNVFVNAVDDPDNASAYLSGVTRRAGVTFAISTDGRAPALAGLLREGLDAVLPESDLRTWVAEAERMRERWQADHVPMADRRPALLRALMKSYDRETH